MKQLTLLASLCGCLSVNAWAQSTVDLAPITIDGESSAEPGLSLEEDEEVAVRAGAVAGAHLGVAAVLALVAEHAAREHADIVVRRAISGNLRRGVRRRGEEAAGHHRLEIQ